MDTIHVRTFGEFSLRMQDKEISESGNRSRRVWSLLAYLICYRGKVFSQKKLIEQLWGDDAGLDNPDNALRIVLYRCRAQLDQLSEGLGRASVLYRDGGYMWNPEIPVTLDFEVFEDLCHREAATEEERMENLLSALELYQGEFLPRQSAESWAIPVCTHFQNLFLEVSQEVSQLLCEHSRFEEAVSVCRKMVTQEPYYEPGYQALMEVLSAMGKPREASQVYEELSNHLFNDFGIRPSEETREVYRQIAHSPEERTIAMDEVLENLREEELLPGALQCDYDYFRILCRLEARAMERSGTVAHIALFNLLSTSDKPLSKRSLNRNMELLGQALRTNLRRGDTVSQCTVSQYIIMLPKANYENSCMVCRRIVSAFHRGSPYANVKVNFVVQPLTSGFQVP